MKIVVDENIPIAEACFGELGQVEKVAGRQLHAQQLNDADVLIVRSITQVDEELLAGTPVKFVGTATIGVDHIDQQYLNKHNIGFASAPGCNATSVAEFVLSSLLELEAIREFSIADKTLGIVGLGNVGTRLKGLAEALGFNVLACDPIKQAEGESGLVSADEVWQADIVSLHVPYTLDGVHATRHLANKSRIENMVEGAVLINTARGPVVDNFALSQVLNERYDLSAVLDVWEGEPFVNLELASQVDIATPHIAGYSYDGKVRGTWMIYQALCAFLQSNVNVSETDLIAENLNLTLDFAPDQAKNPQSARDVIRRIYDIREDDMGLRSSLQLPRAKRAIGFDALRKSYRVRREFSTVTLRDAPLIETLIGADQFRLLQGLGFQIQ